MSRMTKSYIEIFQMHDQNDVCLACHSYVDNYLYTYKEMYKRYSGHLRHLFVFEYHRNGKKDMTEYNDFIRHCQNIGFFGPMAQSHLWTMKVDDRTGYLRFIKWRG